MRKDTKAYHEAGHVAFCINFGEEFEHCSIVEDDHSGGRVRLRGRDHHDELAEQDDALRQVPFERAVMTAMAGVIAQRRYAPEETDEEWDAADDHDSAREYLERLDCLNEEVYAAYWTLLKLKSEALVEELWPRIERLASALMEQKTITYQQAREAFADPEIVAKLADPERAAKLAGLAADLSLSAVQPAPSLAQDLWEARALLAVLLEAWPADEANERRRVVRQVDDCLAEAEARYQRLPQRVRLLLGATINALV